MTTKKTSATEKAAGKGKPDAVVVEGKMSALDAAARVLSEARTAMTCQELIGVMAAKGYWSSPGGKTPAATLHAAISKEISTKGEASRFRKTAPGRFAAAGEGPAPLAPGSARLRKAGGRKRAVTAFATNKEEAEATAEAN